ncbi:MAG: SGNH/GDSL hydrolase family protein [Bacteroidales bacterium]|nr:SGNH/GDSL hydrolase family protein [Bacteroidales bacterium]
MKKINLIICILSLMLISLQNTQAQKKEFTNLKRYQEANEKLQALSKEENRVVFMGNSITDSWPESFFENKPYVNRGISGQTTPQMLIRFRQDVIDLKPGLVVILAGTNDLAGNTGPATLEMITNNIKSMCEIASANNIKVIICSVLPATIFPWRPEVPDPADKIIELNKRLRKYAKQEGHLYLDYYSDLVNSEKGLKDEYAKDAVHPNEAGYKVMGKLAEKVIGEIFKKR